MQKGIAFAGTMLVDYVKIIDYYPTKSMLSKILSVSRHTGGCVPNTGMDLAIIDPSVPVSAYGLVGDDENGAFVIETMRRAGVDTVGVKRSAQHATSFTDVMTEQATGLRTFFHAPGANADFSASDVPWDALDADILHAGYAMIMDALDEADAEYGTGMCRLFATARAKGIKTSLDLSSGENTERLRAVVVPCLRYCDYMIINETEASMLSGIPVREGGRLIEGNLPGICRKIMDWGVSEMVVIHAPEGSWLCTQAGEFLSQPSLKLPDGYIQGTVGAGDAFCAGMLYGIYKGFDLQWTMRFAAGCAAASLSAPNATDGMRPYAQIQELIEKIPFREGIGK